MSAKPEPSKRLALHEVMDLNARFKGASAEQVLAFAAETFGNRLAFACSLGLEDVAVVDLLSRLPRAPRIFFLDTGRLNPETYDTLSALRRRYSLPIETYFPRHEAVEAYVNSHGPNAFYQTLELRKACCAIRKLEPLSRALTGADAWITGLRSDQAPTRTGLERFEIDNAHGGILKINPLADWSLEQTWAHVRQHEVPYNRLHDQGFPSIGCAPCTRAVGPGEDIRAGRWWWETPEHKECGLHAKDPSPKTPQETR
ncbi:phosphoadenylyl-sulfate reductase [Geothrix sp. PMB-07]|nr:phosphoadenylyl-sulfate reductase [Geothrix sp. PMB-07]WLT31195.1 phosphoadenylyl-sulfate reductase [Geothrix sp. PMB-07]